MSGGPAVQPKPGSSGARYALPGSELCVHCGFCLQACPTYLTLDDENDSPRGRIVLMKEMASGALALDDPATRTHLDQCLGCRACETACPSGVPYGSLLEVTRDKLVRATGLPFVARAMLFVFARPALLSLAMFGARVLRELRIAALLSRLPGALGFSMAMLDSTRRPAARAYAAGANPSHESVAVLLGCAMEGLFTNTNRATERVLAANGYRLAAAPSQGCCGALHAHAGLADDARELARTNIAAFEASGADYIAVNSAGCGSAMKEYGHLLHDDPAWRDRAAAFAKRVRDVTELLVQVGPAKGKPLAVRVAYDAPCHLLHAQRVASQPLTVLAAIPGIAAEPLPDAETCCGSAGIYNLVQPGLSQRILAPKLATIAASGAQVVATGNPGCLMQIGAGLRRSGSSVETRHPVELLDQAYAAAAK